MASALKERILHAPALGPADGYGVYLAVRHLPEVAGQEAMVYAALYELEADGEIESRRGANGEITYRLTDGGGTPQPSPRPAQDFAFGDE